MNISIIIVICAFIIFERLLPVFSLALVAIKLENGASRLLWIAAFVHLLPVLPCIVSVVLGATHHSEHMLLIHLLTLALIVTSDMFWKVRKLCLERSSRDQICLSTTIAIFFLVHILPICIYQSSAQKKGGVIIAAFAVDFALYFWVDVTYKSSLARGVGQNRGLVEKLVAMRWERIVFLSLLLIASIATSVCISYGNMRGVLQYIPLTVCLLHPRGVHAIVKLPCSRFNIMPQIREMPCYRARESSNKSLDFVADDQALKALTLFYSQSDGHSARSVTSILELLGPRHKRSLRLIAQALPSGDIRSFMTYSLSSETHIMVMHFLRENGISWSDCNLLHTELEMWLESDEEIV